MAEESLRNKWKFDAKTGYFVVWAIFIAYLFMQHRQVGMYFDDFGNASLSYSYDSSHIAGTAYSVRDLFQWSRYIYFHWGGRILYALILIPLLKTGPHLFMFIQAIIITCTYITLMQLYQLFRPRIHKLLTLSILVISFGVMRNQTLSQGYYWASASVLYVWPLLPFVYSIYRYEKIIIKHSAGEKVTFRDWGCFIFLLPFSILSQEQLAGAFVVWILARALVNRIFEKYWRGNVLLAIASFFLFVVIILAPGNFARMGSNGEYVNQPFLFRSFRSFAILLHLLASENFAWFNELLVVSAGLILFFLYRKIPKALWTVLVLGCVPFALLNSLTCVGIKVDTILQSFMGVGVDAVSPVSLGIRIDAHILDILIIPLFLLFGMSLCMQLLLWWGGDENRRQLPVIVCAVVSVFCLVLSPVYAHRSCIPYVVLCTMIAVFAFDEALAGGNGMLSRWVIPAAVLIFAIAAAGQMGYIYSSYEANRYADEYNRHRLSSYDGESKTICLLKYENDVGRGMAPYDEGFEYIDPWVHEYYDIPGDVAMVWYTQDELMDRLE